MAIHTSRARGLLGGGTSISLAAALWGTTGTAQSVILDTADPFSIGAARIVIGGLLLLVLAFFVERGVRSGGCSQRPGPTGAGSGG